MVQRQAGRGCLPAGRLWSLVLLLVLGAAKAKAGLPDWVLSAAKQPIPAVAPSTKAVVLLNDEIYTVGSNGQATLHVRRVVKILRPQGRIYAEPFVWYDKDSKLLSMHVWSIDPAGHQYTLKDNEMAEFGEPGESGELYSDTRARVAAPPGRDPGGIVGVEYERRERPYLAETNWSFQSELPRVAQSFTLNLPEGYTHSISWSHHKEIAPAQSGSNSFRWEINAQPGIDVEDVPFSPNPESLTARMTVHYAGPGLQAPQEGSWQGIGEWYGQLTRDRSQASPEIAAKAAELTAGKSGFYEKAQAIGQFVQRDIRYFAIEMGKGGYQPHMAQEIFRGRYGDCKDKANLLVTMLSSVGIRATFFMVDTGRGVIDPKAPSIIGNHMIAAIALPEGFQSQSLHSVVKAANGTRFLLFDPTWTKTPFGQIENNLQGSYGVLMAGADSQVLQIPVLSPDLNRIERTGDFKLTEEGALVGSVVEKRFGDLAESRRAMFGKDEKSRQEFLDRTVARDFASVALSSLSVEHLDALDQDLTVHYELHADRFAGNVGTLLMVRPRVLGSDDLNVDRKPRHLPIDLGEAKEIRDDFTIDLPRGYAVDELPPAVHHESAFASYESSTEVKGNTLRFHRTYVQKQITLPPEAYPELQQLAGAIHADEHSQAVLKRSQP